MIICFRVWPDLVWPQSFTSMSVRGLRVCENCAVPLAPAEYIMKGKRLGAKRFGPPLRYSSFGVSGKSHADL
jgi:hypothetical protein